MSVMSTSLWSSCVTCGDRSRGESWVGAAQVSSWPWGLGLAAGGLGGWGRGGACRCELCTPACAGNVHPHGSGPLCVFVLGRHEGTGRPSPPPPSASGTDYSPWEVLEGCRVCPLFAPLAPYQQLVFPRSQKVRTPSAPISQGSGWGTLQNLKQRWGPCRLGPTGTFPVEAVGRPGA